MTNGKSALLSSHSLPGSENASGALSAIQEVRILCFQLTDYNRSTRFLISCSGVFVLYLVYGYMQELIFTVASFESFGWFLTLVQFGFYIIFGFIERRVESQRRKSLLPSMQNAKDLVLQRCIPIRIYIVLAALTLGTMGLSNSSLGYLNYPTQVIFKCCKLIPVMVGSILIQGKRYGLLDFCAALCMCSGLTWFTLVDSHTSPNFSAVGVLMISGALLCDAAIGNVQEKAMRNYRAPSSEVVFYSYGLGFLYLLCILTLTGNLWPGVYLCFQNPKHTFFYGFLFSLSGYLGIHFVLAVVRSSGAAVAATVTTARKAVTIVLSFIFFNKPFSWQYLWSGIIVVLGIYINVATKNYKFTFKTVQEWLRRHKTAKNNKLLANV